MADPDDSDRLFADWLFFVFLLSVEVASLSEGSLSRQRLCRRVFVTSPTTCRSRPARLRARSVCFKTRPYGGARARARLSRRDVRASLCTQSVGRSGVDFNSSGRLYLEWSTDCSMITFVTTAIIT